MKYGEVIPIAYSNVDWQIFIRTTKDEFGLDLVGTTNLKDPTAYLKVLGDLSSKNRRLLQHSWLSIITRLPSVPDIFPVSSLGQIGGNPECVILSGTIQQWYDLVIIGCSGDTEGVMAVLASNIYALLNTTSYKILFDKYKIIRTKEGTVLLL